MKRPLLFIVDDELAIQRLLHRALEAYGYETRIFNNGQGLFEEIHLQTPDLMLLDISLGAGSDGITLCQELRQESKVPIIMLTVQDDKKSKLVALNAGADDFMSKPFDVDELEARIRAVLRRSLYEKTASSTEIIQFENLRIDVLKRRVFLDDNPVHLTNKEYEILQLLASEGGKVVTFDKMLKLIWPPLQSKSPHHNIRVQVNSLRKKLQDNALHPRFIFNEPGLGYRFADIP